MLGQTGVIAFATLSHSTAAIYLAMPLCWFLPARFTWMLLTATLSNRLIWWAVMWRLGTLADGTPSGFDTEPSSFITFAIFGPVILSAIVTLAFKARYRPSAFAALALAALCFLPAMATLWLAPKWFDEVEARFVESARREAKGRKSCIYRDFAGTKDETVSIRRLLYEATRPTLIPSTFYAELFIDTGNKPKEMYWSFKQLAFLPVPDTLIRGPKIPCELKADPSASAMP